MNLYLLRHGEAEASAASSEGRQLTDAGHDEITNVAKQFASRNLAIDRCLVSPALRARQTADTFLSMIFNAPKVEVADDISANQRAVLAMELLESVNDSNVLLVSHNPILSELLALLTDGNVDNMRILGTGNLACVRLDIVGLGMGDCAFVLEPDPALIPVS